MLRAIAGQICALALFATCGCGCTASLDLHASGEGPRWLREHAHTTVLYSGVREDAERFADYSMVDRGIVPTPRGSRFPSWPPPRGKAE